MLFVNQEDIEIIDLANRAQVLKLLSEFEEITDQLTANEFEMFSQIKEKYVSSDVGSFDDKECLEVMLRNISIRKGYGMDKDNATRVINLENSKSSQKTIRIYF